MSFPFFIAAILMSSAPTRRTLSISAAFAMRKRAAIGPKLQMPGTEPIIVIGRNRSGKDAGIGTYNVLAARRASQSVFGSIPGWKQRQLLRRIAGRSGLLMSSIHSASARTFPPDYADLKSDGWGALARYRASDPRLFDYVAWDCEASVQVGQAKPPLQQPRARRSQRGGDDRGDRGRTGSGRVPLLSNARLKVTEGVEYDPQGRASERVGSPPRAAGRKGNPQIAS